MYLLNNIVLELVFFRHIIRSHKRDKETCIQYMLKEDSDYSCGIKR
jgi:hypothetical protein